jgi:hypothetical protein
MTSPAIRWFCSILQQERRWDLPSSLARYDTPSHPTFHVLSDYFHSINHRPQHHQPLSRKWIPGISRACENLNGGHSRLSARSRTHRDDQGSLMMPPQEEVGRGKKKKWY